MSMQRPLGSSHALAAQFTAIRKQSEALTAGLSAEDMMVQSLPEASPAKWHLAHTTWFFETFVLREFAAAYRPTQPDFLWLFNSYYNGISAQPLKKLRACFSRPSLAEILDYRAQIDAAILALLEQDPTEAARACIELGLNHEQQHQELLLTDIKHALSSNPLRPAYQPCAEALAAAAHQAPRPLQWFGYQGGLVEMGHTGPSFCFDNERPRHRVYLEPFELASRPVTCGEYLAFIEDRGYQRSELWLSDGWETVQREGWQAPLYWQSEATEPQTANQTQESAWQVFTLSGLIPLSRLLATPVCHISHYEAEAYARWRGLRLPTEAEWELAASQTSVAGNLLEDDSLHPLPASDQALETQPQQFFGAVWEWTASAYLGYPGYRPAPGALGEYNGKFMSGQMVLRGGSCLTPASHLRPSYRNFFAPATRWQCSGVRLAKD